MVTLNQIKKKISQYLPITVGVMVAIGFSFGILVGLPGFGQIGGGSGPDADFNATMPEQNYQEQQFNLDTREQQTFVLQRDIVFINVFYDTEEQREELSRLQDLADRFDNRVYVSLANSSVDSELIFEHGITDYPSSVIIGANEPYIHGFPEDDLSDETLTGHICDAFNSLGDQAGQCL